MLFRSRPTITSTIPAVAGRNASGWVLALGGSDFSPSPAVTFSGLGITVVNMTYLTPTSAEVTINVDGAAATGTRDIYLTNSDGKKDTLVAGLTVRAAPTLSAVGPDSTFAGTSPFVTIAGTGFYSALAFQATFSNAGIWPSGSATILPGNLLATLTIVSDANVPNGAYHLTLVNGDGDG